MNLRRRRRWALPGAALVSVLGVGGIANVSASASAPRLDPITPAQLLAKVRGATVPPLSGEIAITANLGLPSLSGLGFGSTTPLLTMLSGTHTMSVWMAGPDRVRIALPTSMAETDWIRNGADLWSWDSSTLHVIHATVPTAPAKTTTPPTGAAGDGGGLESLTPIAAAQQLLNNLDPTTAVSVRAPRFVAGHGAYELVLTPRSTTTTIGEVAVFVEATTGLPLDVQVTARGATKPAFEVGFSSLDETAPNPAKFAFTPPPGATVTQATDPTALVTPGLAREFEGHHGIKGALPPPEGPPATSPTSLKPTVVGAAWDGVAIVPAGNLPAPVTSLERVAPAFSSHGVSGRLLTTSLINVFFVSDGRVAVGAVTPDALAAAAAKASP